MKTALSNQLLAPGRGRRGDILSERIAVGIPLLPLNERDGVRLGRATVVSAESCRRRGVQGDGDASELGGELIDEGFDTWGHSQVCPPTFGWTLLQGETKGLNEREGPSSGKRKRQSCHGHLSTWGERSSTTKTVSPAARMSADANQPPSGQRGSPRQQLQREPRRPDGEVPPPLLLLLLNPPAGKARNASPRIPFQHLRSRRSVLAQRESRRKRRGGDHQN